MQDVEVMLDINRGHILGYGIGKCAADTHEKVKMGKDGVWVRIVFSSMSHINASPVLGRQSE